MRVSQLNIGLVFNENGIEKIGIITVGQLSRLKFIKQRVKLLCEILLEFCEGKRTAGEVQWLKKIAKETHLSADKASFFKC